MTTAEFRDKVNSSEQKDLLNRFELSLNLPHINFQNDFKGIISIYEFVSQQDNGWSKTSRDLPDELLTSKLAFTNLKTELLDFANGAKISPHDWANIKSNFERIQKRYFTYESPEVDFLIKVHKEFSKSFIGAYKFIMDDPRGTYLKKDEAIGMMMAYEFTLKDHTQILERRNAEKASLGKIKSNFLNYITETEQRISEYTTNTRNEFTTFSNLAQESEIQKEALFEEWFTNSKHEFIQFDKNANQKVSDLEQTYETLLSLKKPADYWNKRAIILKKEGQSFLKWLIGLILFGCATLYSLLWLTPEGMLLSFIKGQASAIKWSIVYVTFISLLAFGIKAISKAMFSSFHLARDAEEREQLTYVYLAMIKEGAADEKDKTLIMQSLFSRSDTGLLKEDSGPTMPGNVAETVLKK